MAPPRKWSTTTPYATGVDAGNPSRVDPGAGISAVGFLPHTGVAAQYLNSLFGEITDYLHAQVAEPDTIGEIREDFMPGFFETTDNVLYSQYAWRVPETAADITAASEPNNPGYVFSTLTTGEEFVMQLGLTGDVPVRWGYLEEACFVFKVVSAGLTGHETFVGLASQLTVGSLGNDAVGLWFDRATSANWMVRHKVGGVDDATVTSVPVVSNEWVTLKLHRISATQVQVTLNGALVATLTDGTTAPADAELLGVGCNAVAGTATLSPYWDLAYVRWAIPSRHTP